jgi:hypothetical protein
MKQYTSLTQWATKFEKNLGKEASKQYKEPQNMEHFLGIDTPDKMHVFQQFE